MGGNDAIGFASGRFLQPAEAPAAEPPVVAPLPEPATAGLPAVHFRENDADSKRSSTSKRAQPLGEAGQPRRDGAAASDVRVARLNAIVDWLAAESSPRYQRTAFTFYRDRVFFVHA